MLSIPLVLQQLLITLYYRCYSSALLISTFDYNRLLSIISYLYAFIPCMLLMQSLTNLF